MCERWNRGKSLFVGGPADGEWYTTNGRAVFEVLIPWGGPAEIVEEGADELPEVNMKTVKYVKMKFAGEPSGECVTIFVDASMKPSEVLARLVKFYSPKA